MEKRLQELKAKHGENCKPMKMSVFEKRRNTF